jgi:hypothetical protein
MHPHDGNTADLPGQDTHPSPPPEPADADLERRPDNVGQSGRWRHKETGKTSPRYGHEEATHSTDQGWPAPGGDQARKAISLRGPTEVPAPADCFTYPHQWKRLSTNGEKNGYKNGH